MERLDANFFQRCIPRLLLLIRSILHRTLNDFHIATAFERILGRQVGANLREDVTSWPSLQSFLRITFVGHHAYNSAAIHLPRITACLRRANGIITHL